MRKQRGITLIALVVTIIILLILAGVAIATLTGDNGLITKAGKAKDASEQANLEEEVQLVFIESQSDKYFNSNSNIEDKLKSIFEKSYGQGNIEVKKSGKNYKVIVKDTNTRYRVRYNGKVEKYEEIAQATKVYGKLDENNDKILHLRATSPTGSGFEEIKKVYNGNYSISGSYSGIEKIIIDEPIAPTYIAFRDCTELVEIENIENFYTDKMTSMACMFYNCKKLHRVDVTNFDTSNVHYMNHIFYLCESLENVDVSNFETSNVENMAGMFGYSSLEGLDLSGFNTENVINMSCLFLNCSKLKKINLSSFDTCSVENMQQMFAYCREFIDLDLGNFNTKKVNNMNQMFECCSKLETINLSSFDTSKVENMKAMFFYCQKLKSLDLSNFDTLKVTNYTNMFYPIEPTIKLGVNWNPNMTPSSTGYGKTEWKT